MIFLRNKKMQKEEEKEMQLEKKNAIEVHNLTKTYRGNIPAVDSISFSVMPGEIFGLLGPNGAGKTSTIKMIVTLAKATFGRLEVFGVDVSRSPQIARGMMGYVPQSISVDADLTAYENLLIFSKLSYVSKQDRDERIREALQYMGLAGRANDLVKHFSGGMMRRLEIAQALVNRPRILLLDEPSIGLDPASKRQVWKSIKQLRQDYGTTVLITTHDMTEADVLCDRVAIMSAGNIAALGNPAELKRTIGGGDRVTVNFLASAVRPQDMEFLSSLGKVVAIGNNNDDEEGDETSVQILVGDGEEAVPHIMDSFRNNGIQIESISVSKPTLDDVFMKYANRRLDCEEEMVAAAKSNSSGARRDFVRHAK
ncbi:ABC-type multidrug transport system, ATPase component [Candidatus Nitrososphaera evergladensis SR1]|uniref:ABC-type multidrug transport system, ATPase component n=2 Tax=Nitrososphaera TaxID=497726 RepID=A0A075MN65_9ARCH|nr:ABC-type multidrug transport system, ATPase component [Candidatus Nitrososphaera evergladensis SR1]